MGSLILPKLKNLDASKETLDLVLKSRVLTSFLREYADSQFSSESLAFIQAEQNFRAEYDNFVYADKVKQKVQELYDFYLDDEKSEMQICLTSDEAQYVLTRVESQNYAADMFSRLLDNPKLTVERDIFPRFLRSKYFEEMKAYIAEPIKGYVAEYCPDKVTLMDLPDPPDLSDPNLCFTFEQVVSDYFLCRAFLAYLRELRCAENLECLLMIRLYKARHDCVDISPLEARDRAFAIYFRFLHPGSADEVSVDSHQRHYIGQYMAKEKPPLELFDKLERVMMQQLKQHNWAGFASSDAYKELPQLLSAELAAQKTSRRGSQACLLM